MTRPLLVLAVLSGACSPAPVKGPALNPRAIALEVEARVRAYAGVQGPALCENPEPFYAFWTYDHGGVVLAERGKISSLDARSHRDYNRDWFCSVVRQSVIVDSVVVQVLDSNSAVATWTFREETVTKQPATGRIRGEVMQPWVRREGTWRSTGLVATHEPIVP